jgi:large subunit ribosomal protein L19
MYSHIAVLYTAADMTSLLLQKLAKLHLQKVPEIQPGYTVAVHEKIQEGDKERIQVFEGLVIAVHRGHVPTDSTFTVRRIASGVGVEKVFPLHGVSIEKIAVKKVARVRRAKLYFLRGRTGKAARLNERFTTSDEFAVAVAAEPVATQEADADAEGVREGSNNSEESKESQEAAKSETSDSA